MRQRLRGALLRLDVQRRRDGLGDARVQRRGAAGDHEGLVVLVAGAGAAVAVAGAGAHEGGVCAEGGSHCEGLCRFWGWRLKGEARWVVSGSRAWSERWVVEVSMDGGSFKAAIVVG